MSAEAQVNKVQGGNMVSQEESTSAVVRCLEIANLIKSHEKYNSKYIGAFPSERDLADPGAHLPVIAEELEKIAEKLQSGQIKPNYLGVSTEATDLIALSEIIISEISELQFEFPELNIIPRITASQKSISGYTFLNHAREASLPHTYSFIELPDQKRILQQFSAPFYIRLALEDKFRNMVGFKFLKTTRGSRSQTDESFPMSLFIKFLMKKGSIFFALNISLEDVKNIYSWSCKFVHTGQKEYRWLILKALDVVAHLFVNHQGMGGRVQTLKPGMTLDKLQAALNDFTKADKKRNVPGRHWELSDEIYDIKHYIYDSRKYFMGPPRR
ncbi:hypothetical protein FHG55_05070 [Pseudomonas jessenii]|uniref:Uncharacterized protein n=1 Tax=Pseudomonas jessenii TaxID=77298 RepID=A0A5C4L1M9_PSEJE|nr:hypothetical protein [Pseudomonas jessenii]TNB98425.1 hypothetical protein FHG55_05070 [Pseudomonas jessenii]